MGRDNGAPTPGPENRTPTADLWDAQPQARPPRLTRRPRLPETLTSGGEDTATAQTQRATRCRCCRGGDTATWRGKGAAAPHGSEVWHPPRHPAGIGRRVGMATGARTHTPLASRGQTELLVDGVASGPEQPVERGALDVPLQAMALSPVSGTVLTPQGEGGWRAPLAWERHGGPQTHGCGGRAGRRDGLLNEGPTVVVPHAPHRPCQRKPGVQGLCGSWRRHAPTRSTHRVTPHAAGRAPRTECGRPRGRHSGSPGTVHAPSCSGTPSHVALEGPPGRKGPQDVVGVPTGASYTGGVCTGPWEARGGQATRSSVLDAPEEADPTVPS